ncbi:MAG TPA: TM2 domain-containing protein [Saprospiraceae bacterium]|nr:TM2 domain-containing protein [Saprospiraceae bacterium]
MKTKFFILLIALVSVSNLGIASFPVEKAKPVVTSVVTEQPTNVNTVSSQQVQTQDQVQVAEDYTSPAAGGGKSQLIALIIAFFLGGIGIHRFYLGYTWQGVVQLLTLGGCGIWALIDLIRIITGDLKPKDGEYTDKL